MAQSVTNGFAFLIDTLLSLYLLVIMLRTILQTVGANYYNPLSQFLIKLSDPTLKPLQRFIPGYRGIDLAAVVLLLLLALLQNWLLLSVLNGNFMGSMVTPSGLALLSIAQLLQLMLNIYFFAIIIQVIASWFQPKTFNPLLETVHQIIEPLLAPLRQRIPIVAGIDFSPLVAILILQFINIVFLMPLINYATVLAMGIR